MWVKIDILKDISIRMEKIVFALGFPIDFVFGDHAVVVYGSSIEFLKDAMEDVPGIYSYTITEMDQKNLLIICEEEVDYNKKMMSYLLRYPVLQYRQIENIINLTILSSKTEEVELDIRNDITNIIPNKNVVLMDD